MKQTAINKELLQEHVKNSVHDRDENQFNTLKQACKHLYREFTRCYYNEYRQRTQPNEKKAFSDYLRGMVFYFETETPNITEFLQSIEIPCDDLDNEEVLSLYHGLVYEVTISNLR